jgi:hypothetical protein
LLAIDERNNIRTIVGINEGIITMYSCTSILPKKKKKRIAVVVVVVRPRDASKRPHQNKVIPGCKNDENTFWEPNTIPNAKTNVSYVPIEIEKKTKKKVL